VVGERGADCELREDGEEGGAHGADILY
jgi:hypothetical protein